MEKQLPFLWESDTRPPSEGEGILGCERVQQTAMTLSSGTSGVKKVNEPDMSLSSSRRPAACSTTRKRVTNSSVLFLDFPYFFFFKKRGNAICWVGTSNIAASTATVNKLAAASCLANGSTLHHHCQPSQPTNTLLHSKT